jgi:hypothetical protein
VVRWGIDRVLLPRGAPALSPTQRTELGERVRAMTARLHGFVEERPDRRIPNRLTPGLAHLDLAWHPR